MKKKVIFIVMFLLVSTLATGLSLVPYRINAHGTDNKEERLPDVKIKAGIARIKAHVSGYSPDKGLSLMVGNFTPVDSQERLMLTVPFSDDGTAIAEIPMHIAQMAMVEIEDIGSASVVLAPDEEIEIVAKLDGDDSRITDFKGFLAQTHTDLNSLTYDTDEDSRKLCEDIAKCHSPQERLTCLKAELNRQRAYADALPVTEAAKALIRMSAESEYLSWLYHFGINYTGVRAYLKLIDRPTPSEYDRLVEECDKLLPAPPRGTVGTDEYFELLGATYAPLYEDFWDAGTPMTGYAGKDGKINTYNRDIRTMHALISGKDKYDTGQLLASIEHRDCKLLAEQCLAEQHKKAEGLSQAPSVYCRVYDTVAPEDILQVILDKYKDKTVVVDIWATWCAPCLKGHEAMQPLKEELTGKNIVFVYITSSTSPLSTWETMIAQIPGEHYYLTWQQLEYILKQYDSTGFPTYAIYDKNGKRTFLDVGFGGVDKMKQAIEQTEMRLNKSAHE